MITSLRRNWVAWLIMKPSPALALICSATTSASQATPRLCRSPTRICGIAPGSTICVISSRRLRCSTWPSSPSLASTLRMPANAFRYSGIAAPIAMRRIFGSSPMPNQTMNTGISPNSGSVRSICISGSTAFSPIRLRPAMIASISATAGADREADGDPLQRDEHRALQRAVRRRVRGHQRDRGRPDLRGRRQLLRRDEPGSLISCQAASTSTGLIRRSRADPRRRRAGRRPGRSCAGSRAGGAAVAVLRTGAAARTSSAATLGERSSPAMAGLFPGMAAHSWKSGSDEQMKGFWPDVAALTLAPGPAGRRSYRAIGRAVRGRHRALACLRRSTCNRVIR